MSARDDHPASDSETHATTYSGRWFSAPIPKHTLPEHDMPARAAYQLVHDELALDGNPTLNLASFVTTWMEPEAKRLAVDVIDKNLVDKDEYPRTEVIHRRVMSMLGKLFQAPETCRPVGTATVGSSEAIMLGLLAHKFAWRKRCAVAGKPVDRPNVVLSRAVHTCWEKAALYFDIEPRWAPVSRDDTRLTAEAVAERIDENTIAVGAILGNTFTGQVDDVAGIDALLRERLDRDGLEIPIHVDAASGGFVAPFVCPELAWDFRLERVRSINVSNHKFGLVYPGMGSVIFRDESDVPEELVFHITYLGGDAPTFSLNFSQGSAGVILQYYNFLRLGRAGYARVMGNIVENARYLEQRLTELEAFESLSAGTFMPVVAVRLKDGPAFSVFDLSARVRERGWIVPAYSLPPDAEDVSVLRMVVRENFSRDLAELLCDDLRTTLDKLAGRASTVQQPPSEPRRPIC
ncbi:MAG TPA: glutamate decarboxylase [Solirubrobacteraceae bacterium]|nr:glutamate decarboxylase [Solirubrobacteraceae bacterium]